LPFSPAEDVIVSDGIPLRFAEELEAEFVGLRSKAQQWRRNAASTFECSG